MAGVMVATFIVSVRWLPRGRLDHVDDEVPEVRSAVPDSLYS
jgi:hypothetical protein